MRSRLTRVLRRLRITCEPADGMTARDAGARFLHNLMDFGAAAAIGFGIAVALHLSGVSSDSPPDPPTGSSTLEER